MIATKTIPLAARIAAAFSRGLREQLHPNQMLWVIARNRDEINPGTCHSHDFCDANMVMAPCFEEVVGHPLRDGAEFDLDAPIWNAAWTLARALEFDAELIESVSATGPYAEAARSADYRTVFAGWPHLPEADALAAAGWIDRSFRDDACPSFQHPLGKAIIWIDRPEADDREFGADSPRFVANAIGADGTPIGVPPLATGEVFSEVMRAVAAHLSTNP